MKKEREQLEQESEYLDQLFVELSANYKFESSGTHVLLAQAALNSGDKAKVTSVFQELRNNYPNVNSELVAFITLAAITNNVSLATINTYLEDVTEGLQPTGRLAFFKKALDPVSASLVGDLATLKIISSGGDQVLERHEAIGSAISSRTDKKLFSYYNDYSATILNSAAQFADAQIAVDTFTKIAKMIKKDNEAAAVLTLIHTKYSIPIEKIVALFKSIDTNSDSEKFSAIIVFAAVLGNKTVDDVQSNIEKISKKHTVTKETALRLIISKLAHINRESVFLREHDSKSLVFLSGVPISFSHSHVSLFLGKSL